MKKVVINVNPTEALRQQKLLQGLDEALLKQLEGHVRFQYVPDRQMALRQGTEGDALLLVISGRLQVISFSEDGREVGWSFLEAGDFYGEVAVIDAQPRMASVVALTEMTVVGYLPRTIANELMTRHPKVAERVLQHLCKMIRDANRLRAALSAASAHARIFSVLNSTLVHGAGSGQTVIENMPTQQALAMMANVSRESVSRALQLLIRLGVVEKDRRRLIVLQPQRLETLATGQESVPEMTPEP
ncbi:Crp/Fnr family transcriptional regulator [Ferrovum sp.]|uniref:Crp/Fnr family transcriptional regulator n=1 Tax=Ferrovum sp. TaxID=2609467 RepID=UPI00262CB795|nr:Crp/Fnr family transcriptional regulator [Ferrovum sp.]